ncbi:hypothetical protein F2Q69_00032859 [Brassica cretica]|uniref:Pentacotripeptide-repeat region of PRORP domain-containing protein n=1 Tax=Brassica cretica TaxID=69181 RepID=A0A8S9SNE6_BRACR|nr:hypothetical protein F2Q69_00032859 [Brassica cretica]
MEVTSSFISTTSSSKYLTLTSYSPVILPASSLRSIRTDFLGCCHTLRPPPPHHHLRTRAGKRKTSRSSPRLVVRASIDSGLILVVVAVTAFSAIAFAYCQNSFRKRKLSDKVSQVSDKTSQVSDKAIQLSDKVAESPETLHGGKISSSESQQESQHLDAHEGSLVEVNGGFRKKVEEEAHQIQETASETVATSSITRGFRKKVEESANKSEEEEAHQVQEAAVKEYDPFVAKEMAAEESQFAVAGVSTIASEHSSIDESLSSSLSNGHVAVDSATLGTQAPEEQTVMENGFSQAVVGVHSVASPHVVVDDDAHALENKYNGLTQKPIEYSIFTESKREEIHTFYGSNHSSPTSSRLASVERAKEVYKMIHQYGIKGTPEVYTIAVNSCSKSGDWDFACSIYSDMKEKRVFFSALIDVAGHAKMLEEAFGILQDAKSQGIRLGTITYSSLMGACCNAKNWKKALELYEKIKSIKLRPTVSTMNALITALCEGGQLPKAMEYLDEIKTLGLTPNTITYSMLMLASERKDDFEVSFKLLSRAKEDGVSPNFIMCRCITSLCKRRFEKASAAGEPVVSFKSGRPQIENKWTSMALMVYRETISGGTVPTTEVVSQVLGCLQLPHDADLRDRLVSNLGNISSQRQHNIFPLVDGFGEYDPRAFSLLEEATSLGVLPSMSFNKVPLFFDTTELPKNVAELS